MRRELLAFEPLGAILLQLDLPMPSTLPRLVLLPGLDGTGTLFKDFIEALPSDVQITVIRYSSAVSLSYTQILSNLMSVVAALDSFVLIAESFSSPLAIRCAAQRPRGLRAMVLCAGFASSPIRGWRRRAARLFSPITLRLPPPSFAIRRLLVGTDAPGPLVSAVRSAVGSVLADVLSARVHAVLTCDCRAELEQIEVPIFYLRATHDRVVGSSSFTEIQRIRPQTEVAEISGPHLLLQRNPSDAAAIVQRFLQQFAIPSSGPIP